MRNLLRKTSVLLISLLLLTVASVSEAKWRLDEDPELAEPRNFRMASDGWRVTPENEPPTRQGLDILRAAPSAPPPGLLRCMPRFPPLPPPAPLSMMWTCGRSPTVLRTDCP